MSEHRHLRGAITGVAAGGLLIGHWLTYGLVSPRGHARESLLASTGHGYLAIANDLGLMLAVGALAAVVLGRLSDPLRPPADVRRWFARLAWVQVGAFAAMEVLERLFAGAPLGDLIRHGLLPAGAAVQLALAAAGALAIRWLLRATTRLHEALGRSAPLPRLTGILRRALPPVALTVNPLPSAAGIRGPPLPL